MALDPDYALYQSAMATQPSPQWRKATNQLFVDLKVALGVAHLYSAFDVLYLFTAETAQAALLNAAKRNHDATNHGMTFTSRAGFQGDGAATYIDTNYDPAVDGAAYKQDRAAFGVYIGATAIADTAEIGQKYADLWCRKVDVPGYSQFRVNAAAYGAAVSLPTARLFAVDRSGPATTHIYHNGVAKASSSAASTAIASDNFYIGARSNAGAPADFSARQIGMAFIGSSLTATQHAGMYQALINYLVALSTDPDPAVLPDLSGWELHLRHYGRDGSLKNGYIAPVSARYTNSLDGDEPLVFTLETAGYAEMAAIAEFDILEVMIRNRFLGVQSAGGGFVRDFVGIVRGSQPDRSTDEDGVTYLTWYAPEQKHIFAWRRVLWPAGTEDRSQFSGASAETVAKGLVQYNCTDDADSGHGRWRDGDLESGMGVELAIESSLGRGAGVSLSFAGGELLDAMAKVCDLGGDYYTLAWQGGSLDGAHAFSLTWGRGSDKSSGAGRVLLSLENGTMSSPRRRYKAATGTTAVAAGQGEGVDRAVSLVDGPDYAAGNDIELFVDARNATTADGRAGQGTAKLDEAREQSKLDFDVLLTGDVFYSPVAVQGRQTYHVGDRVLASYGDEEVRRIRQATVYWDAGGDGDPFRVAIETELWT